jgi:hypothetical protein
MKVIHVLRKPLSEKTLAANTIKHGTGGLNIDAGRIGTHGETLSCSIADPYHAKDGTQRTWNPTTTRGIERSQHSAGRWPANVILQHLEGCRCEGVKKVKTNVQHHSYKRSGEGFIGNIKSQPEKAHWSNKEAVANWICAPECPVKALDEQSGERPSGGSAATKPRRVGLYEDGLKQVPYTDTGGASRFFKQVGGNEES